MCAYLFVNKHSTDTTFVFWLFPAYLADVTPLPKLTITVVCLQGDASKTQYVEDKLECSLGVFL